MSESRHTPGPWEVKYFDGGECLAVIHYDQRVGFALRRQVADCGPWGEREQENEANATLIARAPDLLAENERLRAINAKLLEACEAIRKHMRDRTYGVRVPVLEQMLDEAIAAAKEGR